MRLVIDNSVVRRQLFCDGDNADIDYAEKNLGILQQDGSVAMASAVWPLEVDNVIVRAELRNQLSEARSAEFPVLLQDMAIETEAQSTSHALSETLQLAHRYGLSTYDAYYLELALREGLPLATNDADLRKALAKTGGTLA